MRQADVTQITMQLGYQRCRRLIDAGMLPGHDSQPPQLTVHVDLAELRGQPAASGLEAGWSTARAAAAGLPGSVHLTGPDAEAAACDAALVPVVSGHIDGNVLDQLTDVFLDTLSHRNGPYSSADGQFPELSELTRERLQNTLLSWSIDLLSGPAGFPAYLRRHLLPARFTSLSQPLDRMSRPHHPGHPPAPPQSRHPAGQEMQIPRLRAAPLGLPGAPPDPLGSGRRDRPGESCAFLSLSPRYCHSPLGLGHHLPPQRHHHRHRTRRTHPPLPRTTHRRGVSA